MSPFKACAAAFLTLATGPLSDLSPFTRRVPPVVPAFQGWERITGDVEIESPRIAIQYEFRVNPERPATYEVVRYRIIQMDAPEGRRYSTSEKLQWDRDGRDVRRFECVAAPAGGCTWREMAKGSKEYMLEVPVLLWLYGLHHEAIHQSARPDSTHMASPCRLILPVAVG